MKRAAGHNWAWRDFWKADRAASCVPEDSANETEILDHWRRFFMSVADGSSVLDIATGNGIVLRQAQAAANKTGKQFALTGIDLADIDPQRYLTGGMGDAIRFIGGTNAERLPFPAGSLDVIVSQYGLEYAALEAALTEAGRVLRTGGRLRWLAHSPDSVVVRQNRAQHGEVDLLLDRTGPLMAMERLVKSIRRKRGVAKPLAKLDAAMRSAERYCHEHPPAGIVKEVCATLTDVANRWQNYYPQDLQKMVDHSRRELLAHRQRLSDMEAATLSPARLRIVRRCLADPAWKEVGIEPLTVGVGSGEIGLVITAQRATSD